MAYVLLVDKVEARALAYAAAGAEVDPDEQRALLDEWLIAEVAPIDRARKELMTVLGLGGG